MSNYLVMNTFHIFHLSLDMANSYLNQIRATMTTRMEFYALTWPKKMKHPYDPWVKLIALTWLGLLIFDLCHWLKVIDLTYHLLKIFMTFFWGASG